MKQPLVSVVTVVYNAEKTLEATIKSVINQDKDLFEYWIIDGGSTDNTLLIVDEYKDQLTGWISEPDRGIYDAMNKAIDRASGKWLYFLGGDDTLRPNILAEMAPKLDERLSIVYGDILFDNGYRMKSFFGPRTLLQNTIHHQSAFYNASLFKMYRYDTTLKIVSEYDLHFNVYSSKALCLYVPLIIADCATGGASSQLSLSLKETNEVRARYMKNKFKAKALSLFLLIYYLQKKLRYVLYGHRV